MWIKSIERFAAFAPKCVIKTMGIQIDSNGSSKEQQQIFLYPTQKNFFFVDWTLNKLQRTIVCILVSYQKLRYLIVAHFVDHFVFLGSGFLYSLLCGSPKVQQCKKQSTQEEEIDFRFFYSSIDWADSDERFTSTMTIRIFFLLLSLENRKMAVESS